MITVTGIKTLDDLVAAGALSKNGDVYATLDDITVGDGTVISRVTADNYFVLNSSHKWSLHPNSDNSAVIEWTPVYDSIVIKDSETNNNAANGGMFFNAGTSQPLIKFNNLYYHYSGGTQSVWTGNKFDVTTVISNSTFNLTNQAGFSFFGKFSEYKDIVFKAATGKTMLFGFIRKLAGFRFENSEVGLKIEKGTGLTLKNFEFDPLSSYDTFSWQPVGNTTAGVFSRRINLIDCSSDLSKLVFNGDGSIANYRTVDVAYKSSTGSGVEDAVLYATDSSGVVVRDSYSFSVEITASGIESRDTDLVTAGGISKINNFFDVFQAGERLDVGGQEITVPENKTESLIPSSLPTSANSLQNITVLEPISDSEGLFASYRIRTAFASANGGINSNGYQNTDSVRQHIDFTASDMLDSYENNNFTLHIVPPYPLRREKLDIVLEHFSLSSFGWSPLASDDPLISETDSAIVGAYTELDTAQKAYDYKEYWKRQNPEVGSVGDDIFILVGDTIYSDYHVDIDSNAAQAFNFDGSVITIKANVFTGSFVSQGVVYLLNGAEIQGAIQDQNGDSQITFSVPSGYDYDVDIYANLTDAQNQTNQLYTGTTFRYQSADIGGQTLLVRANREDGIPAFAPLDIPSLAGVYNDALIVTSENAALGAIKLVTDKLDAMINESNQFTSNALSNSAGLTAAQQAKLDDTYTYAKHAAEFTAND
ncbi:MAG: hypothetical protein SWL02_09980 [Pseudomonadota bacterium]|nr:hypothetical protein [Pseudomonadota bacterium]